MGYNAEFQRVMGLGRETAFGAGGTITEWCNFSEAKFDLEIPLEKVPEMIGQRYNKQTFQRSKMLNPNFSFPCEPNNGLGIVLRSHFGTVADSQVAGAAGGTAYKHTFTYRNNANIDSLWAHVAQIGTLTKNYVGLFPKTLDLSYDKDDNVKLAVTMLGKDEVAGTSNSGTFGTFQPYFSAGDLSVQIGGTVIGDVVNMKVKFESNASPLLAMGTNRSISGIVAGKSDITGEFDIFFQDETQRALFTAKTASTLKIISSGATVIGTAKADLTISFPAVEYASSEFGEKDGAIGATIAFRAKYGANSVGTGDVIVDLVNGQATY